MIEYLIESNHFTSVCIMQYLASYNIPQKGCVKGQILWTNETAAIKDGYI